jgi:hypothetical protein
VSAKSWLLKIFALTLTDEAAIITKPLTSSHEAPGVSYAITNFYFDSQESEERVLKVDSLKIQSPDDEEAQSEDESRSITGIGKMPEFRLRLYSRRWLYSGLH